MIKSATNFLVRISFFLLLIRPGLATAELLRHVVLEPDSVSSMQTQGVCRGFRDLPTRLICLPQIDPKLPQRFIQIDVLGEANEEGFRIVERMQSGNVDKTFLANLFEDENFQKFSALMRIIAFYEGLSLSYTPFNVAGAFKLINPSLPEINIAAMKQSVTRIQRNFVYRLPPPTGEIFFLPSVYYFDRSLYGVTGDLLTISIKELDETLVTKREREVDGSVSFGFLSRQTFFPSVVLHADNLARPVDCFGCTDEFMSLGPHFDATSSVSISYGIGHHIGNSMLGTSLPFWGYWEDLDVFATSIAYSYLLGRMRSSFAFSPLKYSFGFDFFSDNYRLGVQYTDEKQANAIKADRDKATYVHASFLL